MAIILLSTQISPRTASGSRKRNTNRTIVYFPNTKPSSHVKAHKHICSSKYATITPTRDLENRFYTKLDEAGSFLRSISDPAQDLVVVDVIQRLGIDYYFQDQIEDILQRHVHDHHHISSYSASHDDPHHVSLRFRLLRQHGFNISADVFNKYKDGVKHFDKGLKHDIRGLMGFFEASHLSCRGEDLLDEVGNFSKQILLEKLAHELDPHQATIVRNRLANPFHKSLARFTAKDFILEFQAPNQEWTNIFRELQILDSNMVKSVHQKEIMQVSEWWKELGLHKELKLVRNEPEKWYMWALAMVTDPSMSALRVELTKPISLIYIIDDIFDVLGTLEELTFFTDVIQRWDLDALEQLPRYMYMCFKALNDTTNEISYRIYKDHGWNPVQSLRLAWGSLCKAYLVEARWYGSGKLPKAEEYLENGMVTSGVEVALVHLFFLLGQNASQQSAQLVSHMPSVISSSATILRLWDDLASGEEENREEQEGSYLKYYMNEHQGTTMKDARAYALDEISKAWKELNGAWISPSPFHKLYKETCLNLARMCPLMYNYDENHELPILQTHMRSLLSYNINHTYD